MSVTITEDEIKAAAHVIHSAWCDGEFCWKPHDPDYDTARRAIAAAKKAAVRANHTIDGTQDTSRLAALRARPNSGTQRAKILDFIERRGPYGATDEEIQASLGLSPNSERPRRVELVTGGWVVDSGARRLTESGNDSIVWISWTDGEGDDE